MQLTEIEAVIRQLNQPRYRAGQIFAWLYKAVPSPKSAKQAARAGSAASLDDMKNLPLSLRTQLKDAGYHTGAFKSQQVQISAHDGTRKYLFELQDGNAIESVFMKYKYGNTICISSQAGCRMGCKFCASTIGGLCRSLTPGEMSEQLLAAERDTGEPISRIVVMGSGEPFDNYGNLSDFIRIMNDPAGRGMGMRNITVSTCGLIPGIEKFGEDFSQVNLAVSLHGATDEIRNKIMPVNRRYPLARLMEVCRRYTKKTSRRVTFEYTLVKGFNDSMKDAEKLCGLLSGMLCHVNFIPLNKVEETGLDASTRQTAEEFAALLSGAGIPATVRRELGDDIDGACGQLRLKRK